jgi:hypothetical protein
MKREKRQRKLIEVVFTEDFATSKAGESAKYEPSLACNLISRGIAELKTEESTQAPKKNETKSKNKKSKEK